MISPLSSGIAAANAAAVGSKPGGTVAGPVDVVAAIADPDIEGLHLGAESRTLLRYHERVYTTRPRK